MLMCESCLAYHLGNHYPRMVVLHIEIRDLRENTLTYSNWIYSTAYTLSDPHQAVRREYNHTNVRDLEEVLR